MKQLSIFSRLLNCNTHHLNQNSSQIYVDDDNFAVLDKDDLFLMVNESVAYRWYKWYDIYEGFSKKIITSWYNVLY